MHSKIEAIAAKYADRVVEWRRAIHRHPELSGKEERTSALVAEVLRGLGAEVRENVGGHGVVGLLKGEGGGGEKCVGLRADMDALPMAEETGLPFASESAGVCHACGHDTHTAMLLGAACVLNELRRELRGTVKFVFQPAEEANPTGGAPGMIKDGVLENPHVDGMFALHVWPKLETGCISTREGALMGASDRVFLTVKGRTSHGSAPHQGVDAIMIAAQVLGGLQTIVSRTIAPTDSAVVSVGVIKGGYRYNVIADKVEMEGTVRTLLPETQDAMPGLIERTAKGYAEALGGGAEIRYVRGYPPTVNSPEMFAIAREVVTKSMGEEAFVNAGQPDLGGEDFSFFARERPCLMAWLGCRPAGQRLEGTSMLHNTGFNADENCFPLGVRFLAGCAAEFLK
ncbi:MAG: amidohydrolase [Synergistaceae bacterium]|nr:amidohydrolase [Synergistaceae bacterium]